MDYPVMMRLRGRRCVVVGAGPVGWRKAEKLLAAGAEVVLVSPDLGSGPHPAGATIIPRTFSENDLDGAFLAFAATDSSATNREVAAAARARSIPVNIADAPEAGDFVLPASFSRGRLTVTVATGGVSPAVAVMVRDELQKSLANEWVIFLEIAGKLRSRQLTSGAKAAYNQQVLHNIVAGGMLAMIANVDEAGIDRLLEAEFGQGYSLADLGISLSEGLS